MKPTFTHLIYAGFVLLAASTAVGVWMMRYNGGGMGRPRHPRTSGDLYVLKLDLERYRSDCGQLPTQKQGLEALVKRPADLPAAVQWRQIEQELTRDPWGNPYHYLRNDAFPDGFGIYSHGADGISCSGGFDSDDIRSWEKD